MRFWDSSALVPLFVAQGATPAMRALLEVDAEIAAWCLSDLELRSAFARLARDGHVPLRELQGASEALERLWTMWTVVIHLESVKARAQRLVAVHPLRPADALQLAAALVLVQDRPLRAELVTLDSRLADAARREGFRVLPD